MRPIIYHLQVSLDGFVEGPGGDLSWTSPGPELHQHFNDLVAGLDAQLYGRGMYETMSAFWPTADEDPAAPPEVKEYARIWREQPKYVFSRTLQSVGWNSTLLKGDLAEDVRKLKAQPGKALGVGGAGLAQSLLRLGLVDEIGVYVFPVLLGGGKSMFGPLDHPLGLRLLEQRLFPGGVVLLRYAAS